MTEASKKKTPVRKTVARKASAARIEAPAIDMAAVLAAAPAAVTIEPAPETAITLKKKELVERVASAVGGKKKDIKEIVEATLAVLGEALQKGEALNLPPFGRAKVARSKGEGKASAMTVKLRGAGEKNAPKAKKEALAEAGEDS